MLTSGEMVGIGPSGGISDPDAFSQNHPEMRLIQNDEFFNAALVSMGSMGVVADYVIETRDAFYL